MKSSVAKILLIRLLSSLVVLFLLISSIFILLRIAPGDPVLKFVSQEFSSELADKVRLSFHLNGSISDQYLAFVRNMISGDFGISYNYHLPVLSVIGNYLLFTLLFSSICFTVQIVFSYKLAITVYNKKGRLLDKALSGIALVAYSIPGFVTATILIYIFSIGFHILPSSGFTSINFDELSMLEKIFDYLKHLVLPVATLSLSSMVIFYKYLRDNFDTVSKKSFVIFLRTLGLDENEILKEHIVPNSVGPLISVAGVQLGMLLSGSLITEVIFGLPGMGRLTVNAILLRDYPLVVGCAFISGVMVILSNFIADLLKAKIDKRLLKDILN